MDNKIIIEVLNGTQAMSGGCNCSSSCPSAASCGPEASPEEDTAKISSELEKIYGEKVSVKYVDTDKEGLNEYPIMERVLSMGYPYPIILINGQPRFAGKIVLDEIKTSIEEELKAN